MNLPGRLTARQVEILRVLSEGLSDRDIAVHLKISDGTVARHIANIYRKIGVTNRVGAVRFALAYGLGSPLENRKTAEATARRGKSPHLEFVAAAVASEVAQHERRNAGRAA